MLVVLKQKNITFTYTKLQQLIWHFAPESHFAVDDFDTTKKTIDKDKI